VGALTLPSSGLVYLDANPIIYTVEKHPVYAPLLQPLWLAAQTNAIEAISSELALMEAGWTFQGRQRCLRAPV
jgi:hypothetical protein